MTRQPSTGRTVLTVAGRECTDLWRGGRGPILLLAFGVLLSVITYLTATNQVLNFLEQREAVSLLLQTAVAVGALVTLLLCADAVSGERERDTLEALIVTPAPRLAILAGKWLAAMSWWVASFVVTVPYLWALGHGVGVTAAAVLAGALAGTVLAAALSLVALLISCVAAANRTSLATSLLLLLALFAPTQLPTGLPQSWFGHLLDWLNPISAGLRYVSGVVISGHHWIRDLGYLASPAILAVAVCVCLVAWGEKAMTTTLGRAHD
jgi:ABC-2 type transport system permease protein